MNGEIVWYSPARRYGFVTPVDGGGDVVFRVDEDATATFVPGMAVHFLLRDSPAGPIALDVAPGHIPEI